MFIIPVKYSKEHNHIYKCIERIREFHSNELIFIVDSYSDDTSYLELHDMYDNISLYLSNENYGPGAFSIGYSEYPNEDVYYCIYDSLIINSNLEDLAQNPVTAFRYFNTPPTGWGWDENETSLEDWALEHFGWVPKNFHGIMGPMFIAQNLVMTQLKERGIFGILPTNKYELCAMERIYGIILEELGYDFWTNAPQGEMTDFFGDYPTDRVEKINAARM